MAPADAKKTHKARLLLAMGKNVREAAAGAGVRAGLARKARVEAIPF